MNTTNPLPTEISNSERPDPALWTYYILRAVATGPGIVFTLPYLYFRYHTLRYRFDAEGVHMKVGILFRREVNLTYARIQDIHLRSNFVQRWLGLANLQVQTASGSSGPELVIEGFKHYEALRDFLYTRMRGYHTADSDVPVRTFDPAAPPPAVNAEREMIALLSEIREELHLTREALAQRKQS
jgi:membrane protein YdbS with pleckstrin-like domain